jgi:cell wall-associated NlpC family hydrolase
LAPPAAATWTGVEAGPRVDSRTAPHAPPADGAAKNRRSLLLDLAERLRDVRYRRGGGDPSTGFDCSGFVRYVFAHGLGLILPRSSVAQFATGRKVDKRELQPGDLVFFHIRGKRISHVGIYVDDGRFIHAPSSGKKVRVDRLDEKYWARRYAGAKRVEAIAQS